MIQVTGKHSLIIIMVLNRIGLMLEVIHETIAKKILEGLVNIPTPLLIQILAKVLFSMQKSVAFSYHKRTNEGRGLLGIRFET